MSIVLTFSMEDLDVPRVIYAHYMHCFILCMHWVMYIAVAVLSKLTEQLVSHSANAEVEPALWALITCTKCVWTFLHLYKDLFSLHIM